jgi:hypothetical protein
MAALLISALFATCTLLAVGVLAHAWARYGGEWLALHRQLAGSADERAIPTAFAGFPPLRSPGPASPRFRAGGLRQSPALPLRAAA